jgi:uncharacterized protein (TIGR02594 family)
MVNGDSDTPSWLARARRELGVREGKDDTRILQYHQCTGLKARSSKVPWCASYVCFCLEQEGVKSTRSAAAASYKMFGKESEVRPGAIIVFGPKDLDSGHTGHVGFVNATPKGLYVQVVSGNQNNRVTLKNYRISDAVAIRWPEFP